MAGRKRNAANKTRQSTLPKEVELNKASSAQILRFFSTPSDWKSAQIERTPVVRRGNWRRAQKPGLGLGSLGRLPMEILYMLLFLLDYPSLGRLCGTNTFFEAVIKGIPSYKLVMEHCTEPLGRLTSPEYKFLPVPTMGQMHQAFTDPRCSSKCGRLGDVLFMPTWTRSCKECIERKLILATLNVQGLTSFYNIPEHVVTAIRHTVGDRTDDARPPTSGPWAIENPSAEDAIARYHAALDDDIILFSWLFKSAASQVCAPFVLLDPESNKAEFGRRCVLCGKDNLLQELLEMMNGGHDRNHRCSFTAKGLIKHVRDGECPRAKEAWRRRNHELRIKKAARSQA